MRWTGNGVATDFCLYQSYTRGEAEAKAWEGIGVHIYKGLVAGLNFLVDFLLILGTNRLAGFSPGIKRGALAAIFGAAYSLLCMMDGFRFLSGLLWRAVSLGFMAVIGFGTDRSAIRRCGIFLLLTMALGGIAARADSPNLWTILGSGAGVWLLCHVGFGGRDSGGRCVPLVIQHGDKIVRLLALWDTGNTLRDPVTGERALVIDAQAALELTGLTKRELQTPLETMAGQTVAGLRLIPYHCVGQNRGMLLAMRFERVELAGRKASALVAFAPDNIGTDGEYRALAGGMLS